MKQKEIYEFLKRIVKLLDDKVKAEAVSSLPESSKEYTKGQLYEAGYILEIIEGIIFRD